VEHVLLHPTSDCPCYLPVPVAVAVVGLLLALLMTVIVFVVAPTVVGLNVTSSLQFRPGAIGTLQVPIPTVNGAVVVAVAGLMTRFRVPVFVTSDVLVLVAPRRIVPKVTLATVAVAAAGSMPVPVSPTIVGEPAAL
jgi:hypothetical protein